MRVKQNWSYIMFAYQFGLDPEVFKNDTMGKRRAQELAVSAALLLASYLTWSIFNTHALSLILAVAALTLTLRSSLSQGRIEKEYDRVLAGSMRAYVEGYTATSDFVDEVTAFQRRVEELVGANDSK